MLVPVLLATLLASASSPKGCPEGLRMVRTAQDATPLWKGRDSLDRSGPAYMARSSELMKVIECRKGWVRVRTRDGSDFWCTASRLVPATMAVDSTMALEAGKIEGYLDNPSAVYILSEESSVRGAADMASVGGVGMGGAGGAMRGKAAPSPAASGAKPNASGLRAGVSDDNQQYAAFLEFLRTSGRGNPDARTGERIRVRLLDSKGRGVPDQMLRVLDGSRTIETVRSLSDGTCWIFPALWGDSVKTVSVKTGGSSGETKVERDGPREIEIAVADSLRKGTGLPVDLVFVMDATSSMSGEIQQLKKAVSILEMNLSSMPARPQLRFGLVVFRDRGDDFLVRTIPLTAEVDTFARKLEAVEAGGGGDGPEDLQSAMDSAVRSMNWSKNGIRLAYVVTDAPPHLDYGQTFGYVDAAHEARRRGIRIHTVGMGGLDMRGEVSLRQIAQIAGGKYVFLTYGERGESEGGHEGAVSHHTGDNWTSERLETVLLRLARDEIARIADVPPVDSSGWFEAASTSGESRDTVLAELLRKAVGELVDFSSLRLGDSETVAILPMVPSSDSLKAGAGLLEQVLTISVTRSPRFRLVDRGNIGLVLREIALQRSGAVDGAEVAKTGKLLGARYLIASGVATRGDRRELLLKLLRVETGEVLSATRARIDRKLLE